MTDPNRLREPTRTELRRICEEFKSERDAAKATAMRAVEERNIAFAEATQLRDRLAAVEKERDETYERAANVCECVGRPSISADGETFYTATGMCAAAIRALARTEAARQHVAESAQTPLDPLDTPTL